MTFLLAMLARIQQRSDLVLVVLLLTIIFMIILPLPTWLIDTFISINIAIVLLTLAIVFYLRNPADLSTLPALLLFSTIFRLAISISTTRLILLQADAGSIVQAFGDFVVGGNIIIGIIVFLIITIVQFIVITKGSERVAEVGARFALDSLPGKQMAIDADMRAGEIDITEAKSRRNRLRVENDFYGSMDGAMKFVKGDSIAGLIIIAVNLIGGVAVGAWQNGMDFGTAMEVYTVLTIGDGLVSQIPALIMAIAAGIATTRISEDETSESDLGTDIIRQLSGGGKELIIAGGAMVLFAFIPGFPTLTFLIIAGLFLSVGVLVMRTRKSQIELSDETEHAGKLSYQLQATVRLELSQDLSRTLDLEELSAQLERNCRRLYQQIGIPFPSIGLSELTDGRKKNWRLKIEGVESISGNFPVGQVCVDAEERDLEAAGVEFVTIEINDTPYRWIPIAALKELESFGFSQKSTEVLLAQLACDELPRHAEDIVGVEEVETLLATAESRFSTLVAAVRKATPPERLVLILRPLVAERVPLTNIRAILEAILEWSPRENDPSTLSEFVRTALARQISDQYANEDRMIPAYLLDPDIESTLRDSIMHNSLGSFMALSPDQSRKLVENIKTTIGDIEEHESTPIFVTAMDVRPHFRKFLKNNGLIYTVLSQKEIYGSIELYPLGIVGSS